MNKKNTEHLFKSYPILYTGKDQPITENLMPFGFECGDGWFKLIDDLSKKIEEYNNSCKDEVEYCIAVQVNEKFGDLRFYTDGGNDDVYKWTSEAEDMSYNICECCGKPGEANRSGYIQVLCEQCKNRRKAQQ